MVTATAKSIRQLLRSVTDPEIPVLTIEDLGIVRDVSVVGDGVIVTVTPTYSGCPAMDVIRDEIRSTLAAAGFDSVSIETVYTPAWTTDWMSEEGKRKLAEFGIAPPGAVSDDDAVVLCPRCDADAARTVSPFGSTACKALMVCGDCGEPFDLFKPI